MPEDGALAAGESLPCRVTCCMCPCTAWETGALGWAMLETKPASTFPIPVCVCVCVCVCARALGDTVQIDTSVSSSFDERGSGRSGLPPQCIFPLPTPPSRQCCFLQQVTHTPSNSYLECDSGVSGGCSLIKSQHSGIRSYNE